MLKNEKLRLFRSLNLRDLRAFAREALALALARGTGVSAGSTEQICVRVLPAPGLGCLD